MFSRVTIGFGAALIVVSALAAATGATTISTAIIPAILGGLFILAVWLDRRMAPHQSARQRSPSRYPTLLAAALAVSSASGIKPVFDALGTGTPPSATGIFLFAMVVAGVGYMAFGVGSDIAEARRVARARAEASRPAARRSRRSGRSGR